MHYGKGLLQWTKCFIARRKHKIKNKYLPSSTSNAGVICKGIGSISCDCVSPSVTSWYLATVMDLLLVSLLTFLEGDLDLIISSGCRDTETWNVNYFLSLIQIESKEKIQYSLVDVFDFVCNENLIYTLLRLCRNIFVKI